MGSEAPLPYRADLDGLRAVAVLLVMGFHAFPGRVPGGFIGVDVFFVISGYLIASLLLRDLRQGTFGIGRFYARRVRRIFPALSLVLITSLLVGRATLAPTEFAQLGQHAAASAAFVVNLVLWAQSGYFATGLESRPLLHLWSLGVEEQFYLAWPVALAFLFRRTAPSWLPVLAIAAASLALNLYLVCGSPEAAFYSPLTRLWELLVGGLLAYHREAPAPAPRGTLRGAASGLGLGLVVLAAVVFDGSQSFPGWRAIVPVAGTALLIEAGPGAWLNRALLAHPLPVFVGLISYPLYLWHWPALALSPLLDVAWSENQERMLKLLVLAGSGVAAYLTYRFVERPVRFAKVGSTAALCLAMAVPLVAGALVAAVGYRAQLPDNPRRREIAEWMAYQQEQRPELFRDRHCSLGEDQDATQFASECFASAETRPGESTLLWGDSHAAHLAPGIRSHGVPSGFAQLSATSCPPILGYAARRRPHCADINRWVLEWVKRHRPRTILLAASWPSYDGYQELAGTVVELEALHGPRVVVVGPVPSFRERVSDVLARESSDTALPERLPSSRLARLRRADSELREIATRAGADYVSPLSLLCNDRDCLVAPGGTTAGILLFDQSHLTAAGSSYVAERLLDPYLR